MNIAAQGSLSESWSPQCRSGVWDFHCRQTWRIINYPTLCRLRRVSPNQILWTSVTQKVRLQISCTA
jgi:hypothetical protein